MRFFTVFSVSPNNHSCFKAYLGTHRERNGILTELKEGTGKDLIWFGIFFGLDFFISWVKKDFKKCHVA